MNNQEETLMVVEIIDSTYAHIPVHSAVRVL